MEYVRILLHAIPINFFLIEEGLLQTACMCGFSWRACENLGVDIILQEVCTDRPDSTQILFSSPIACNRVKTILIWEKSAFAWKYSLHFWFHKALYTVSSQTDGWIMLCNHPIIGLKIKKDLNLLQEIRQLINGLVWRRQKVAKGCLMSCRSACLPEICSDLHLPPPRLVVTS